MEFSSRYIKLFHPLPYYIDFLPINAYIAPRTWLSGADGTETGPVIMIDGFPPGNYVVQFWLCDKFGYPKKEEDRRLLLFVKKVS